MTDLVPRTVTELGENGSPVSRPAVSDDDLDRGSASERGDSTDWERVLAGEDSRAGSEPSRSMEAYRESDAYVLLGAPGAGKTELFKAEGGRAGCHYVSARDFLTLGERPGWREPDATLFIDGLDEKRAGSVDGRTPLDGIRAKLDALDRPRFRLSCREADWFGANDRAHLKTVSRNGRVDVLRLDPLSDQDIRELLARHSGIDRPDTFMQEARDRGIDNLLTNPQTLKMLADTVSKGTWPETRTETFELACEKLVQEFNPEHRLAIPDGPAPPELLSTAGRLCAVPLLTGHAGYATDCSEDDPEYLDLTLIPGNARATLRLTLGTRLFESIDESRRIPTHRQIAEYLGARYLSGLIKDGIPVRRVLALMSGEDGGIVSDLRGLSAWLAAHCPQARGELIERDPEGVAAYGDAGVFTPSEKRSLLECLHPPDPSLDASLFTSIVTPDMASVIGNILSDWRRDDEHRNLVLFLLCVLANATPLPELGGLLYSVAAGDDHSARCRLWASTCLAMGARSQPERFGDIVHRLLSGLRDGSIRDEGRRMLGELLQALYPTFIGPDEVFRYRDADRGGSDVFRESTGSYEFFWRHRLAEASRPEDMEIILDGIGEFFDASESWKLTGDPPDPALAQTAGTLVASALDRLGDRDPERTLRWLRLVGGEGWTDADSLNTIRDWIDAEPTRYNELVREGIAQCLKSTDFNACAMRVKEPLCSARTPSGYARWCLDEASRSAQLEDLAGFWFAEAWFALRHRNCADGLTRGELESFAAGNPRLTGLLDDLRSLDERAIEQSSRLHQVNQDRRREREQALANRRQYFRQHEAALRENRCPSGPLNSIAEAWWGRYTDIRGANGEERLHDLLGEASLVEAAMAGLRNSIHRNDVPSAGEVFTLWADNQLHALARPVVAGLTMHASDDLSGLDDEQTRLAIASFLADRPHFPEPRWFRPLVEARPELAAEQIVRFAGNELRRGERHVSFVYETLDFDWMAEVARNACPKLLRTFPIRAPHHLLNVLKRLLWWGIDNPEASTIASVATGKLGTKSMTRAQRAYWLAAQFVVSSEPDVTVIEDFAGKHPNAMEGFFVFFDSSRIRKMLLDRLPSPSLGRLARLLGAGRRPLGAMEAQSALLRESDFVRTLTGALAVRADDDATSALAMLGDDPNMASWRPTIRRLQQEQRVLRRDAVYQPPSVEAVLQTLNRRQPANAADLAALTFDLVAETSRNIRHGNTNDWRQYWVKGGESWRPAHEDDCRDALLSDLKSKLHPLGVDSIPEGRYVDGKRSDIRVSYGEFNVPVEIKKSSSRDLWRAIRDQLIAKYTRDPGSAGYGIYLVLWFGNDPDPCQMPESGTRPRNAADLEERLRGSLTPEEARFISICVIDVARP